MLTKEKKVVIKKERDVVNQEKNEIKQEIKQEIKLENDQDSFKDSFKELTVAESSSTEEPANKKRKKSHTKEKTSLNNNKKQKSFWTLEEDQALFDAVTSFVNGNWKGVCSKHPSLTERGPKMVHQRWNTKSKYFLRAKSGNGGK